MKKLAVKVGKVIAVILVLALVVGIEWVRELWVANDFNKENAKQYEASEMNTVSELPDKPTKIALVPLENVPFASTFVISSESPEKRIGVNSYKISGDGSLETIPTFLDAMETVLIYVGYPLLISLLYTISDLFTLIPLVYLPFYLINKEN